MRWLLLCLILCGGSGCASTSEFHRNRTLYVNVDANFLAHEMNGIRDGLTAWEDAVGNLSFVMSEQPHTTILDLNNRVGDIVIMRNVDGADADCWSGPLGPRKFVGVHNEYRGMSYICMDAGYTNSHGARWRQLTMHEVGHALRLQHASPPSVMTEMFKDIAPTIQPKDVEAYKAANEH